MKAKTIKILPQAALFLACIFWGTAYYISKEVINVMHPVTLVAYRMLAGGIILGLLQLILKKNLLNNFKHGIILGLLLVILMVTQSVGLKITTAANSGFISGMFIVFVPLISYLVYKEKTSPIKLIAIGIAVLGLWFLTGGVGGMNLGDVLTIVTAAFYGIRITYVGQLAKKEEIDPVALTFHQFWVTGVAALIIAFIGGYSFSIGGSTNGFRLLYLILFPTVIAFVLGLWAQKRMSAVSAALIIVFDPVFAAIFAWTLGGEKFVAISAFGGLLIVIGMIVSEIKIKSKRGQVKPQPLMQHSTLMC